MNVCLERPHRLLEKVSKNPLLLIVETARITTRDLVVRLNSCLVVLLHLAVKAPKNLLEISKLLKQKLTATTQ